MKIRGFFDNFEKPLFLCAGENLTATRLKFQFLMQLKQVFNLPLVRHTTLLNKPIKKVALCGGAGSFLISKALAAAADVYVTADIKYHEFFDAHNRILIADIGHYESEQYTSALLKELIVRNFSTFAVRLTELVTNPVHYY